MLIKIENCNIKPKDSQCNPKVKEAQLQTILFFWESIADKLEFGNVGPIQSRQIEFGIVGQIHHR